MSTERTRIAMWSGPRNISTALLRSWGNREDTFVNDEPLYAAFLDETGFDHPIAQEIVDYYETDWSKVVAGLTGKIPGGKTIYYQKHMAHHLLPGMGREWIHGLDNCFLLRNPAEMLTSLGSRSAESVRICCRVSSTRMSIPSRPKTPCTPSGLQ